MAHGRGFGCLVLASFLDLLLEFEVDFQVHCPSEIRESSKRQVGFTGKLLVDQRPLQFELSRQILLRERSFDFLLCQSAQKFTSDLPQQASGGSSPVSDIKLKGRHLGSPLAHIEYHRRLTPGAVALSQFDNRDRGRVL